MVAVDWEWYLGRSSDFTRIGSLQNASSKQITLALNNREAAGLTISPLDPIYPKIQPVTTCLLAYRNDLLAWTGPCWTDTAMMPSDGSPAQINFLGWFELLNHFLLKCNGTGAQGSTTGIATALQVTYPAIDQCAIAADLVGRAVFDAQFHGAPMYVQMGSQPAATQPRNITYQAYANIGQSIAQLSQIESGFDFRVDPTTRLFNIYYDPIWPQGGPYTVNGRGQIRPQAIFGYHWGRQNVAKLTRTRDASTLENDVFAIGQLGGVGEGYEPGSQSLYGMFESQTSLSDVIQEPVLQAYAQAEATTNSMPRVIYTFDQQPLGKTPDGKFTALQPFVDFDIGDFVSLRSDYGILVPDPVSNVQGHQPVRVFAFTVNVSDEGVESVTNIQTTFQATS